MCFSPRLALAVLLISPGALAQTSGQSASTPPKRAKASASSATSTLDAGAVSNNVYHNKSLALTCRIPDGWVLRTDELNARDDDKTRDAKGNPAQPDTPPASSTGAKVLLAAFSRPPEAKAEDVNSSILIAAESASAYPGLTEPAQYFFPLTEVAKAQGFTPDEDPYEIAVGAKPLVRGDFHKDVGTRIMRQSTLVMLSHGYAISITIIAGTDDDVEDLIDGLTFATPAK